MTIIAYALCNLFPYVGMMVKDLLDLETTNEAGMVPNAQSRCYTHSQVTPPGLPGLYGGANIVLGVRYVWRTIVKYR